MQNHPKLLRVPAVCIACGFLILAFWSAPALAVPPDMPPIPGNPIVDLQQQIIALEQRVIELEGMPQVPQEFTVDCTVGEKIADVLALVASGRKPVTITINGVCQESVSITRDNITLRGASAGSGLQVISPNWFALHLWGARRIRLEQLTLTGGAHGVHATNAASFDASELHIIGTSNAGFHVTSEASGSLSNSIIEDCDRGIVAWGSGTLYVNGGEVKTSSTFGVSTAGESYIQLDGGFKVTGSGGQAVFAGGGSIEIGDAIVEDNQSVGVWAMGGGSISIRGSNTHIRRNNGGVVAWAGTISVGGGAQVTENHGSGISGTFGGHVDLGDGAKVENNEGAGIWIRGGSSAQVSGSFIQHNDWDGIRLDDTSVAIFQGDPNVISNNGGHGITCNSVPPNVAQISGDPGTVASNTANPQIYCFGYYTP